MAARDHLSTAEIQAIRAWTTHFYGYDGPVDFTDDGQVEHLGTKDVIMRSENLKHIPVTLKTLGGGLSLGDNDLQDLRGCPETLPGSLWLGNQPNLPNLVGAPRWINGSLDMQHSTPPSLEGLPEYVGASIVMRYNRNLGLLRLCLVRGAPELYLRRVPGNLGIPKAPGTSDRQEWLMATAIMERYIGTGRAGVMPCAAELHKAGCSGNAKL